MSDLNAKHNRIVWCDIPVANLERALGFYRAVLGVRVHHEKFEGMEMGVIDHDAGNGGCLVVDPQNVSKGGALIYLNANGRIREATDQAAKHGGQVVEPVVAIGPHGYRSVVIDSEGNRIALHSEVDG